MMRESKRCTTHPFLSFPAQRINSTSLTVILIAALHVLSGGYEEPTYVPCRDSHARVKNTDIISSSKLGSREYRKCAPIYLASGFHEPQPLQRTDASPLLTVSLSRQTRTMLEHAQLVPVVTVAVDHMRKNV